MHICILPQTPFVGPLGPILFLLVFTAQTNLTENNLHMKTQKYCIKYNVNQFRENLIGGIACAPRNGRLLAYVNKGEYV